MISTLTPLICILTSTTQATSIRASRYTQILSHNSILPPEANTIEHECKSVNASTQIALANNPSSEVQPTMSGL